jgi:hypothetical protein
MVHNERGHQLITYYSASTLADHLRSDNQQSCEGVQLLIEDAALTLG